MKRRALGKGIEAIISNQPQEFPGGGVTEIDVASIFTNPFQPRKHFKSEKIKELADSIKESGLIQPIVVFKENDKFYLFVGERRWRAAQYLKWEKIPAIIRDLTRDEAIVGALVENIQREDLNPIEIAEGIELLMEKQQLIQETTAEKLGMSRSAVANYLRLLKLPETVKRGLMEGDISQGHARALLTLEDHSDILDAYANVVKKKLSVRQVENLVKQIGKVKEEQILYVDPDILKMEDKLARLFSTKVVLKYAPSGQGKIEIFFNKTEEFERIYKLIDKE